MQSIIQEKRCKAIIRLGPVVRYREYPENEMGAPVYAMNDWEDFDATAVESLHTFITTVVEQIPKGGPLLVHCRAGIGRTGTFVICYSIYQIVKQAKGKSITIDPVD